MQPAGEEIARLALPSAHQINKQLPVLYFTENRRSSCSAACRSDAMVKSQMPAEVWLLSCPCSLALSSNSLRRHGLSLAERGGGCHLPCPSPLSGGAAFIETQTKEKL